MSVRTVLEKRPKKEIMKLSDAFVHKMEEPELELICTVYNINPGVGDEMLSSCRVLHEYTQFVEKVRYFASVTEEGPVSQAIDWCIENHILEDFLRRRRPEVLKNMTIDMTFERREELIRQEVREEGREEGRKEGREEGRQEGLAEGKIEGKQLSVIELLEELGAVPDGLRETIMSQTDTEILSKLHKLAARCSSIEEFKGKI